MNPRTRLLCAVITTGLCAAAGSGLAESTLFNPVPYRTLRGAAYGQGLFVVVGDRGTLLSSSNGTLWTEHATGTTDLLGVAYGSGRFVAVGASGTVFSSTNGAQWTQGAVSASPRTNLTGIAFGDVGGGLFVVVDEAGQIHTSANGTNWTRTYLSATDEQFFGVTFGYGMFVAVGLDLDTSYNTRGVIRTSYDGTTWTRRRYQVDEELYGVAWANGQFMAVGVRYDSESYSYSRLVTSSVGTSSWTVRTVSGDATLCTAGYGNGMYWVGGEFGALYSSADGRTGWTAAPYEADDFEDYLAMVTSPEGRLVVAGSRLLVASCAGGAWVDLMNIASLDLRQIAYGNGRYVALGTDGIVWFSTNRLEWVPVRVAFPNLEFVDFTGLTFGSGTFLLVGTAEKVNSTDSVGLVALSTDGCTWSASRATLDETINDVAYGNGFVAVGDYFSAGVYHPLLLSSTLPWTGWSRVAGPSSADGFGLLGVTYGGPGFVAVGEAGTILHSTNRANWTDWTVDTLADLEAVAYGQNRFLAVGTGGEIWTSSSGTNWEAVAPLVTSALHKVLATGPRFLAVGDRGTILVSSDGLSWGQAVSPTSQNLRGATFAEGSFTVTGDAGTILTSPDGSSWTRLAGPPPPPQMSITRTDPNVCLVLAGEPGSSWRLEYTADLRQAKSWTVFTNVILPIGSMAITNPVAPGVNRFFRAAH